MYFGIHSSVHTALPFRIGRDMSMLLLTSSLAKKSCPCHVQRGLKRRARAPQSTNCQAIIGNCKHLVIFFLLYTVV